FAASNALESTDFFIGRSYLEVCDVATGDDSEEAREVAQGLRAVLTGQQPSFTLEYPCHSPREQRWFRLIATPVSTARHAGAVVMHVDITERIESEHRLRDEQSRLAGLIDAAMDGIITVDAALTIVSVNPAAEAIFGWSAAQILGQPLTRLIPTRFVTRHAEVLRAFGITGRSSRRKGTLAAFWGVRADGREFPVEASFSQIKVGGEKFYTAILRDVTERRQAEANLQRTSEQMRALARHLQVIRDEQAAHIARELHDELGQTLTVLKLHVRAMQKRLEAHANEPPSFEAREAVELIETSFSNLRRLCTELRPPMLDHLGLGPALDALAADFQSHSGIVCTLEAPTDFPLLEAACQATVYRLVQELLTNVARHSGASAVCIVLRETESTLELEVIDNGRGIADTEQTGKKSLGLLGMRERALAAGGTITFEGHPGHGTTARARLPLTPIPEPP
ncbi:MAG: PAS domain S-box protein, partial [Polyangiaceae bacterium]